MSASEDLIHIFLDAREATFVAGISLIAGIDVLVLDIPMDKVHEKAGNGTTSRRQLAHLRGALERRFKVRVLVSFRASENLTNLEAGVKAVVHNGRPDVALACIAKGFCFVTVGSDARLLAAGSQDFLTAMRKGG